MSRPTPGATSRADRLEALVARAATSAAQSAHQLGVLREELVELMTSRSKRAWTVKEFERYLSRSRAEATAERRYANARRRFDEARARARREEIGAGAQRS
jgi:hypothetical protein